MNKFLSVAFVGLLYFAFPIFMLCFWGGKAAERRTTLQHPGPLVSVVNTFERYGGRTYGMRYFATVRFETPTEVEDREVEVTEDERDTLRPGQRVAVSINPATPQILLTSARWWMWRWNSFFCIALSIALLRTGLQITFAKKDNAAPESPPVIPTPTP